jgi:hypothetical protein
VSREGRDGLCRLGDGDLATAAVCPEAEQEGLRGATVERGGRLEEGRGVCECGSTQGGWEGFNYGGGLRTARRSAHRLVEVCSERGQECDDKKRDRGCANESKQAGCGLWREIMRGDGRVARGEDAQLMPARCSMQGRLPEHGRVRPRGGIQKGWRAREGSRSARGAQWRGGSGNGTHLKN